MLNPILRKNLSRELQWNEMDSNFEKTAILLNQEKLKEKFTVVTDFIKNDCIYWDRTQFVFRRSDIITASQESPVIYTICKGNEIITPYGPARNLIERNIIYSQYDFEKKQHAGALINGTFSYNLIAGLADSPVTNITTTNTTITEMEYTDFTSMKEIKSVPLNGLTSNVTVTSAVLARYRFDSFVVLLTGTVPAVKIKLQNTSFSDEWIEFNFQLSTGQILNSQTGSEADIYDTYIAPAYTDKNYYRVAIFYKLIKEWTNGSATTTVTFTPINLDGSDFIGDGANHFTFIAPSISASLSLKTICSEQLSTEEGNKELDFYYLQISNLDYTNMQRSSSFYFDIDLVSCFKSVNVDDFTIREEAILFEVYTLEIDYYISVVLTASGFNVLIRNPDIISNVNITSEINFSYKGKVRTAITFNNNVIKIFINGNLLYTFDLISLGSAWDPYSNISDLIVGEQGVLAWGKYIALSEYSFTDAEATTLTTIV